MKYYVGIICLLALGTAQAACNVDSHHPRNGGYFVEGVAGHARNATGSTIDDPSLPGYQKAVNSTWATGIDYPDGSTVICTGRFCSTQCATVGCPTLTEGTTCSNLRFCYTEDSGSDVWKLPNEVALANCNFTEAEPVCTTTEGAGEDCCNYVVEEDAMLGSYFFASKDGCAQGQRTAFNIADYDQSGDSCYNSGLGTSRIAKCTCLAENTLVNPCASEFQQGCLYNSPEDTACCADESCVPNSLNYEHPDGKAKEDNRVNLCLDDTPGRCMSDGVADCCTQTCSGCGTQLHPTAVWETCESGNSTDLTGNCGASFSWATYTSTPNVCDFAACEATSFWHQETDAFKEWIANYVPLKSIVELIQETPELETLLMAATNTDVAGILSGDGPFTLLAPTNDAFAKLEISEDDYLAMVADGSVSNILKGHAASGTVLSTDLSEGQVISTVSGLDVTVSLADGVTFTGPTNTAKVTIADMVASNGVIHIIDAVIMPAEPEKSIVELITDTPELSTLLSAATNTDVAGILSGAGPFTVLAPTNDAFTALGLSVTDLAALISDGTISTILKGHAASGTVLSTDLSEGQVISTVSGLELTVSLVDGVTFTGPTNTVKVTMADMVAGNGVIHVIDAVIMPAETVSESVASESVASESVASEDVSEEASPAFKLMVGSALASAVVGFALL